MDWSVVIKISASIIAVGMVTFSTTYSAHPDAALIAYVAAICSSVGSYVLGLFQAKPTGGQP